MEPTMGEFEQTCKQVDAQFDGVMKNHSGNEPAPVMLIRAAARLAMTTYPASRLKDRVMDGLLESAGHLKSLEEMSDVHHD